MDIKNLFAVSIVAVGLVGIAPPVFAKKLTPTEFREGLKSSIGHRKGSAAYNKAARFFQKAIGDKKNKNYAKKYAKFVVKALRGGTVKTKLIGKATNTLLKGLIGGYFKRIKFNLYDRKFNQALVVLLKSIPLSQKTAPVSQALYNTLKTYSLRKGLTQSDVYTFYQTVDVSNRLPPPVS